jgi:hypothetical protein
MPISIDFVVLIVIVRSAALDSSIIQTIPARELVSLAAVRKGSMALYAPGRGFLGDLGSQAAAPSRHKLYGEERSIYFSPERETLHILFSRERSTPGRRCPGEPISKKTIRPVALTCL